MLEKIQKHLYLVPYLFLIFVILDFSYQKNMVPKNAFLAFSACSAVILVFSVGLRLFWRRITDSMIGALKAIFSFAALVYFLRDVGSAEIFPTPAFYYTLTVPLIIFTLINLFNELKGYFYIDHEVLNKELEPKQNGFNIAVIKQNNIELSAKIKKANYRILNLQTRIKALKENNHRANELEELLLLKQQNSELLVELEQLKSAVNSQEVLPVNDLDENYNPTERETHLLMIDAMAKLLTNQNFNVNKYIRGKNINKKQISEDITEHITEVLNTPETKSRSLETIRKRLDEALKLNE